jgi:hypothetical protein
MIFVNKLNFNGFKEAFCYCIIPTVTFSAHTSANPFIRNQYIIRESIVGMLDATVGMKNKVLLIGGIVVWLALSPLLIDIQQPFGRTGR